MNTNSTKHRLSNESYHAYCQKTGTLETKDGLIMWEYLISQMNGWYDTSCILSRNTDYYRNICVQVGETLGKEAYTCDDGTIVPDVLIDKIVELVEKLQK